MIVHVFQGKSKSYGFTPDQSGANLTPTLGPWKYLKTLHLEAGQKRIAIDVDEALADIATKGYHILQAEVTFDEITNA